MKFKVDANLPAELVSLGQQAADGRTERLVKGDVGDQPPAEEAAWAAAGAVD